MKKNIVIILLTILSFGINDLAQNKTDREWVKNPATSMYSLENENKVKEDFYKQNQIKYATNVDMVRVVKDLVSIDEDQKLNAISILGLIPGNNQISTIEDLLVNDPSLSVKLECAKSLKFLKSTNSISVLLSVLKSEDEQLKLEIALTLAALGEKIESFKTLEEIGRTGDRNIIIVTHLGYLDIATHDAVEKLKFDLLNTNSYVSVDAAIVLSELGYFEDAFSVLKSKLMDEDKFIRIAALRGLAYIGNDKAIELIKSMLNDSEQLVKDRSELILKNCHVPFFLNELLRKNINITYNPTAAASYAEQWWNAPNPAYSQVYYNSGNDCANYVSQCLIAGGINLTAGPGLDGYGCIPACDNLHTNFTNYQGCIYSSSYSGHKDSGYPSWFVQGDVAMFGSSLNHPSDPWEHAAINVVTGTPALDAHTNNRHKVTVGFYYPQSASAASFRTGDFYHFTSTVVSLPGSFTLTLTPECNGTTSQIRLNWTESSGATSYDVYRNGILYPAGTGLTGTQFINSGNITVGTNYSYYVQAKNTSGSTNSNTQSATAPNCNSTITVTAPNGGENWQAGTTQNITWTSSGVTGTVQIQPYLNGVAQNNINAAAPNTGSYSWTIPTNYTTATTYKIGISAMSGTVSDFSNSNFTIISPQVVPTLLSPVNNSHPTGSFSFQWNNVSNATNYRCWILLPGSSNWLNDVTTLTNYPFSPTQLGEFHWKVQSYVNGIWSDYSSEWVFYWDGLQSPSLMSPVNNSHSSVLKPTFQWNLLSGANYYELQLAKNDSFGDMVRDNLTIYGSSWQLDNQELVSGQIYYWKVRSSNPIGQWSSVWNFQVVTNVTISGYVRTSNGSSINSVVMNGLPNNPNTDANGYYTGTVNYGWTGTVTPTKNSYTFNPTSQSYSNVTSNLSTDYVGTEPVSVEQISQVIPDRFALSQNHPNPFNPSTIISYDLPKEGMVTIKIYDLLGREVKTLVDEYKSAGSYSVEFDARNLTSGTYFYRLTSGDFTEIKKLILMK